MADFSFTKKEIGTLVQLVGYNMNADNFSGADIKALIYKSKSFVEKLKDGTVTWKVDIFA